jgi:hypothetical protein
VDGSRRAGWRCVVLLLGRSLTLLGSSCRTRGTVKLEELSPSPRRRRLPMEHHWHGGCQHGTWAAIVRFRAGEVSCSSYLAPHYPLRLRKTRPHQLPGGPPPPYPICSSTGTSCSNTTPSPTSRPVPRNIPLPSSLSRKGMQRNLSTLAAGASHMSCFPNLGAQEWKKQH